MNPLFTIGYSKHPWERFVDLLRKQRINAIADVRSSPYSARCPMYSRETLAESLRTNGIRYVFLGVELGARRDERKCYVNGKVDYRLIANTPAFHVGMNRLRRGIEHFRIALLCAEKEPLDCHRAILVARHACRFVAIQHIHADGSVETQSEMEQRLLARFDLSRDELFSSRDELLTTAYDRRGHEIAWVEQASVRTQDEL